MEGENKTIVEDLRCRYYVKSDHYVLACVSESGIKVVHEVGIFGNQAWNYTYVGEGIDIPLNGIATPEFRGKLIRRVIDGLVVTDALADNLRIIEVEKPGRWVVTVTGKAGSLDIGEDLAWHLRHQMPVHKVLDVVANIVDNAEKVKRQLRERLMRIDTKFPEIPISVKYGKEVEYYKAEIREKFNVWKSNGVLKIKVPASCRKDIIAMEGNKFGVGIRCVANKPSKVPSREVVAVKDGIYLTTEALYFSAYLEEENLVHKLQCLEVGDRCLSVMRDSAEKNGIMIIDSFTSPASVDIIEGNGYKAYAIDIYPKLFYIEVDGEAIKLTERDIEKLGELLKERKDRVKKAVEDALRRMGYSSVLDLVISNPP